MTTEERWIFRRAFEGREMAPYQGRHFLSTCAITSIIRRSLQVLVVSITRAGLQEYSKTLYEGPHTSYLCSTPEAIPKQPIHKMLHLESGIRFVFLTLFQYLKVEQSWTIGCGLQVECTIALSNLQAQGSYYFVSTAVNWGMGRQLGS